MYLSRTSRPSPAAGCSPAHKAVMRQSREAVQRAGEFRDDGATIFRSWARSAPMSAMVVRRDFGRLVSRSVYAPQMARRGGGTVSRSGPCRDTPGYEGPSRLHLELPTGRDATVRLESKFARAEIWLNDAVIGSLGPKGAIRAGSAASEDEVYMLKGPHATARADMRHKKGYEITCEFPSGQDDRTFNVSINGRYGDAIRAHRILRIAVAVDGNEVYAE
jgi:hypothetical protein